MGPPGRLRSGRPTATQGAGSQSVRRGSALLGERSQRREVHGHADRNPRRNRSEGHLRGVSSGGVGGQEGAGEVLSARGRAAVERVESLSFRKKLNAFIKRGFCSDVIVKLFLLL